MPEDKNSITITDNRTGKTYDLPVENGTIRAILKRCGPNISFHQFAHLIFSRRALREIPNAIQHVTATTSFCILGGLDKSEVRAQSEKLFKSFWGKCFHRSMNEMQFGSIIRSQLIDKWRQLDLKFLLLLE